MSKFSVKKPLTVFVAVIAVLVLGVVAYFKMTPDLLPNMDFPYVIVMTTYPGASPEKVENEITRPMEQAMSTLEHIKTVSSTSSENVSMVMLEFEESINMDTVGVDIQQQISTLSAAWDDMVGIPFVLKINPSMLPVEVAGVSMEGMDTMELTDFLNDRLINKLEGIPGVARISTTGMIQQELHVVLDQTLIDELNRKIADTINGELDSAAAELTEKMDEVKAAQDQLNAAQSQMNVGSGMLDDVSSQLEELVVEQATVRAEYEALKALADQFENGEARIQAAQAEKEALAAQLEALRREIAELEEAAADPENTEAAEQLIIKRAELVSLEARAAINEAELSAAIQAMAAAESMLDSLDLTREELPEALEKAEKAVARADRQIASMLESAKDGAAMLMQMGSLQAKLEIGKNSLSQALTQMETGLDTIEDSRETALSQADLNAIITMEMVTQILTAQNFAMPAGYARQDGISYMVSVGDEITQLETLQNLLLFDLGMEDIEPIYLKDVARVFLTDNSAETYAKLNGRDGVLLSFEKQSTYATAETTNNIADRFRELEAEFPGLKFVSLMNQGDYIYIIVESILSSLLLGAVFAILVLFLFLKDLRPTFITLCSIPISVIFAIVLMYFSGVTINMISLSGLAVAVGMLVDNSVVVIENIYRLRAKGANVIQAAVSGAMQVAGAVTASTLTTVCVFLPIVFVEGITRQLFTDLALTMTYSLMASLIVSLTLVPAMASGMLRRDRPIREGILEKKLLPLYARAARWALGHKAVILIAAVIALIATGYLSIAKGFIFMPEMDMSTVNVSITMPEGADMEEASALADEALARIAAVEGIDTVGAMMGGGSLLGGMGGGESRNVTVYVTLEDETGSGNAVGLQIEEACADLECTVSAASASSGMTMLTGSGISLNLFADKVEDLQNAARTTAEILEGIEGVESVSDGMEDAAPALHIGIDRNAAMKKGLTVAQVYMEIAAKLTADSTVAALELDGVSTDIIVSKPEGAVLDVEGLRNYVFEVKDREGNNQEVPLRAFAVVRETESLTSLNRVNQRRYLSVSAQVEEGYNVTLVTAQAQARLKAVDLGPGVTYEFTGENETIMEAMEQLLLMLLLGVLLVYLVMVAQFQSLLSPFIVMFTIPLAFTGGFLGLLVCGMEFSVISLIGFIMLTGIIVNNGIVLVDYINQLRTEGVERREAIVEAGVTRMRPILMTTITTVLGLMDMALRENVGTAMIQPIAVVCIGGLTYATLMTLFVVPVIYDIFNKKELRSVRAEDLKMLDL